MACPARYSFLKRGLFWLVPGVLSMCLAACVSQKNPQTAGGESTAGPYPQHYEELIKTHMARYFDKHSRLSYGFREPRFVRARNHEDLAPLLAGDAWLVDTTLVVTNPAGQSPAARQYVAAIVDGGVVMILEHTNGRLQPAATLLKD